MLSYLLFSFYIISLCVLITRIGFIKSAGIERKYLVSLYLIKVAAGLFLGWFSVTYYPENDYWSLHNYAQQDTRILLNNPEHFFSDVIYSGYQDRYGNFFSPTGSYWNDLTNNLLVKLVAI